MVQVAAVGMIRPLTGSALLALALSGCASAPVDRPTPVVVPVPAPAANPGKLLEALFTDDARQQLELSPLEQLYRGKQIDPASLNQIYTDEQTRAQRQLAIASLARLARIDRRALNPAQQISYDVFERSRKDDLAWLQPDVQALTKVRPFNHFGGLHVEFPTLMATGGVAKYETVEDYRRNLAIDRAFAAVLDRATLRFREGMASGVVESKLTVRNMIGQIDGLLAQKAEDSPFASPLSAFPDTVSEADRALLRRDYERAISSEIFPAYRRLRDFLANDYLPAAREAPGISAMKGGDRIYRMLIHTNTTVDMEPDAIHQLGLSEVARIQRDMDGIRRQMGFKGTLPQFFDYIRTNPKFHPKTREELVEGFHTIGSKVDALIPQYFSRVPKTKLMIEPYPAYREKYEAGASYNQGLADGSRPGTFYFNTYDLPSRFLTGIDTLYLHEGVPGHHFQISLALEDETLPDFQRYGGNNAFVEGWALYSETLGYDMGFYNDPMQHWGTLDDEMLRAMRLVVDTGLHTKGWSRDQAIAYMLANSGMGKSDATAEVERYIAYPAQATSYKIGALTILRLRDKAKAALGPRFDIRKFHEQVLGSGALPLPILEAKIDRWIAGGGG